MKFYEATPIINKAVENLARVKGIDLETKDLTADQWLVFYLSILKHIEAAQRKSREIIPCLIIFWLTI